MYWMGIDIGSISTDLVLLNDKNEIEKELYLKTGSTPVKAVCGGLKILGEMYSSDEIRGVGQRKESWRCSCRC